MFRNWVVLFAAVILLTVSVVPVFARDKQKQTDKPAIVFLVAGQSNAGGCGVISTELHKKLGRHKKRPLVPGSTAVEVGLSVDAADYTHSYMWVPKQGFQRTDPKANCRPQSLNGNWHGMELPVIRELEKRFPDNDIFVVKYGPGGTNLHTQWNPNGKNNKYTTWLGYYKNAMAYLTKEYSEVRVAGLYWDQGESDGIDKKHAEYAKNLAAFAAAVRRDTGVPQLKLFIRKHIFNWPNIDAIIAAQEQVAKDDPLCYLLDIDLGSRKANYQAWAYSPGNGHVSSKGFVELTRKLFDGPLRDATIESFDIYSAAKGSKISKQTDLLAKISYENVKRLRYPKQQETPDWARKVFEEKVRVLKERAVKSYEETGRWYYVKYDNGDCGSSIWWDEVSTARVYVVLQGLLGGIENLPNYSPENHKKAIAFWQSWQNEKTGVFHNPLFIDPQNPEIMRQTPGYSSKQYFNRGPNGVDQKYLPNLLAELGSAPLYEVAEDRKLAEEDVASTVRGIEKALVHGTSSVDIIGNQVTRQIWVMSDHIDKGKTEFIPDYERLMSLLLRRFDARTGLLGRTNFGSYGVSANNVKCNARIIGYMGLENYPYRKALADSLADAFSERGLERKGGIRHWSGCIRNWSYLSSLVLQQTDHRSDDLYKAIENLAKGFAKGGNPGYTWMAMSTAAAWLNWDIASCEAFKDPSVDFCYNGVNRPYRSVVGPFGRWVNLIPRAPEETYGNEGFSWDNHSLRARNVEHEKRKVIDIAPATSEGFTKSTDEQGRVTLKRSFILGDDKLQNPYLKAKWNGNIEIYLNDVLVKKVSGNFPEYCGLYVPKAAAETLRKGRNVITVKAVNPSDNLIVDLGVIDWQLPQDAIKPAIALAGNSDIVKTKIDWRSFLARHDMVWKRLPGNWRESPWTGNGMLGSMSWVEGDAMRLQVFRGDVQAHRPMTQGFSGYTRGRLQIGSFYLKPQGKPVDCDLRLSLYDAEVAGTFVTQKGGLKIRQFTHSEDMVIVTELESADGNEPVSLSWKPASSMPTRGGYAKTEADFPRMRKAYLSKFPTEVFHPNPDPVIKVVDGVNVCIQDMLGGSRHVTAWKMIKTGDGKQRLAVSIANRWPKETNDALAEAVAAVSKVCEMDANAYNAWKQKHYDWWHGYYPASFVSVPDTEVETVYWTTMYKLGSATRSDRVLIDTAGIWQTPSRWPDSHWDFNIPYCYYPMPTANHVELGYSLIRTIDKFQGNLIKNVRPVEWQKDSSYLPVCTGMDLYQPKDVDDRCFQNTGGHLVWAMHACWLIYRGNMDDTILRETIYPIMKRAANYQIHRLVKRDGKYHAPVSHSPEYGDAPNANYELSMLRWICHAIVASGSRLDVDDTELAKYHDILANLVDYPVDERGYMVGEDMSFNRNHRHWCHMQMMHPLQLITGKTAAERELMEKTIRNFAKVNKGGSDNAPFQFTGTAAIWALLGDGDKALDDLYRFMRSPTNCANSMNHYGGKNPCLETPVYAAHNVHELLLQCYDEFPDSGQMQATIRVFPAVPSKWPGAVFHNLRTKGAFLISAEHKDGRTQWVRVKSINGEPCRIKPSLAGRVRISGGRKFSLKDLGDGIYELDLKQGEEALLYSGDTAPKPTVVPLPAQNERCNRYGLN